MSKMSAKDSKESKGFEKLKQFFRINKGGAGLLRPPEEFALSPELERDLCAETSMSHRTKTIKELSETVLNHRLEDHAIEKLWRCLEDLLHESVARDHRHLAFSFFRSLVQGQYERLGLMRVHFFRLVKNHNLPEDIVPRLELLHSLTDGGRDILHMEEEVGPLLVAWMPVVTEAGGEQELLNVLVNVIKYNATYLDEDLIAGLIQNTCHLCCHSSTEQVVLNCLQVLDTIVCYNMLPPESLPVFVATLCRSVNIEVYCPTSWKIMRNLLGTSLGHASLYTMCRILQDRHSLGDVGLLRGAVFHINMALWGSGRVATLHCTPASVLPSFRLALECGHTLVMYEVVLSIQRLVNKCGLELQDPTWDTILSIVEAVIQHIENSVSTEMSATSSSTTLVANHLHEMLCTIEQLIELGQFNGSVRRVFQLIERCSPVRPEVSVLRLVSFLSGSIVPTCHLWISKLDSLLDRYYRQETRTAIRLKALDVLATVLENNRACYAEELIDRVVLPHLDAVDQETDVAVRSAVAQLLVDLCLECETKRLDIMDVLDKLLVRPFDQCGGGEPGSGGLTETEAHDVKVVVHGICRVFVAAIFQLPSAHAVRAYRMLVTHLEMHYTRPYVFDAVPSIRQTIFELLLNLRVDSSYRLGLADGRRFSPYLLVERRGGGTGSTPSSSPPPSPAPPHYHHPDTTHLTLSLACRQIVTCLKQELDWKVVLLILQGIPQVMKNKALVLSRHGNDIDMLAAALCSTVNERSLTPESLRNTPPKFTRSEWQGYVFPVLAALVSYHTHIEPSLQQKLIKCLELGLASRSVSQCIMALTTCTLEMRDTMVKLLPEVLLNLSKISATVHIAMPILEFLSTLTRLPKVFANFVGEQYMSVFAISLRYTNPFKYNHYTVSLAHHVIAVWFLKCRLPFRREFVKFITSGLKDNVLVPFEEGQVMKTDIVNEDSSNRKRSSSLTEQGSRRRERSSAITSRQNLHATADLKPPIDEALMAFHRELTETCVDLMARYTFSTCSSVPKRHPTAERLLAGGQSMTWLLGNKLITVTTSGCSYKALRNGLCDRCSQICRIDKDVVLPQTPPSEPAAADFEGKPSRPMLKLPLTRSISNDISPLIGVSQLSNSSTAASSPSEETKRGLEATLSDADSSRLSYGVADKQERQMCACWCQGWAEIYVRRPTGDMSWAMRLQNPPTGHPLSCDDLPLMDISTMLLPSLSTRATPPSVPADHPLLVEDSAMVVPDRVTSEPVSIPTSPVQRSPSRHSSRDSVDTIGTDDYDDGQGDDVGSKSRTPVRRSNSSPEMSASWKNPFMAAGGCGLAGGAGGGGACEDGAEPTDGKKKQNYAKDLRVNCEAIPEELGTTPPLSEQTLLTLSMAHVASSVSVQTSRGEAMDVTKIEVRRTSVTAAGTAERPVAMSAEGTEIHKTIIKINQPMDSTADRTADVAVADGVGQKAGVTQHGPLTPTLPHLTTKPPLSPPPSQLSPRLQPKLTKASEMAMSNLDPSALPPLGFKRDRGHTISVMSPVRKPRSEWSDPPGTKTRSPRSAKEHPRSGVNPSFVFLQLYHDAHFGSSSEKPLLLSAQHERAVKNLDWIPLYETHTVGVLYIGPGQADSETDILRNKFGSLRYTEFLQRLGTLIKLSEVDPQNVFLGGLDTDDNDGKFAYVWQDDVTQVTFHVATLMPTLENDPHCTKKKKHIGNDYVSIVYNESGEEYNIRTVKCQFNFACVIVQPLEGGRNEVRVRARQELVQVIGHSDPKVVSDQNVAILARQLALHANLASMISRSLTQGGRDPYASNWLERLRQIKRIRARVLQEGSVEGGTGTSAHDRADRHAPRRIYMDDFTEYT